MIEDEYFDNDILLDYCLGVLSDEDYLRIETVLKGSTALQDQVNIVRDSLEKYLRIYEKTPPTDLKSRILSILTNLTLEEQMDPENLPLVNKYSDHGRWLQFASEFLPSTISEEKFERVIRNSDGVLQILIASSSDYGNEIHEDVLESVFILKGTCNCLIEDSVTFLFPGKCIDIPLHKLHSFHLTSSYVVGIIQRIQL